MTFRRLNSVKVRALAGVSLRRIEAALPAIDWLAFDTWLVANA